MSSINKLERIQGRLKKLDKSLDNITITDNSQKIVNDLHNNLIKIVNESKNNDEILKQILNLKINGKKIINKKNPKTINKIKKSIPKFKKYTKDLQQFFDNVNKKQPFSEYNQKTGGAQQNIPIPNINNISFDLMSVGKNMLTRIFKTALYSLFTLSRLEQNPNYGGLVSLQLDIFEIILQGLDFMLELISPILEELLDVLLSAVGAIPGVGTVSSIIEVVIGIFDDLIFFLFEEGMDIIALFINISRQDWEMVLMTLLEVIPEFPSILGTITTNIAKINDITSLFIDSGAFDFFGNIVNNILGIGGNIAGNILGQGSNDKYKQLLQNPDVQKILKDNLEKLPVNIVSSLVGGNKIFDSIDNTTELLKKKINDF